MDVQVLAILVGLCALVIGLGVYVLSRLSLFGKSPEEAPTVGSDAGFQPAGVGFLFFGLMVICMIGFSVWVVQIMELQGRTAIRVYGGVPILVGLVFSALYFFLKSLGVRFWKNPK